MRITKKILIMLLVAVKCITLIACTSSKIIGPDGNEVLVCVANDGTKAEIFGLICYDGDDPVGCMSLLPAGGENQSGEAEFLLRKEDLPKDANLKDFGLQFWAREESGVEFSVATLYFPIQFGNTYRFKLTTEDGCYAVWSELDGKTFSGPQVNAIGQNGEEQSIEVSAEELIGPWHLNEEKTDTNAILAAWETFPGFGEWGASMEISSKGLLSWYIGSAGGAGTYSIEGNVLHTEILNQDQKEISMDLSILSKDEIQMSYEGIEFYWVYGDHEPGNNSFADWPDVVELINLRGDITTAYYLADGSYMDREETRYFFDGIETWTDENGVIWNETIH